MKRVALVFALFAGLMLVTPVAAKSRVSLSGEYLEARTCDVWVGACFANAEMNISGKHATLCWKFDQGEYEGVKLDGLAVVAVVEASNTLGLEQKGPAKAVLYLDDKGDCHQLGALTTLARKLGGTLTQNVVAIKKAKITFDRKCCAQAGCAKLTVAGIGAVETRCIHEDEDKVCGHEDNFYPPLTKGVEAKSAMVLSHEYAGPGLGMTWEDASRRGAYVGTFKISE